VLDWQNKWAVGHKNKKQSMAFQKDGHITWIDGLLYLQKQRRVLGDYLFGWMWLKCKVHCVQTNLPSGAMKCCFKESWLFFFICWTKFPEYVCTVFDEVYSLLVSKWKYQMLTLHLVNISWIRCSNKINIIGRVGTLNAT
jgi:hypothetical protein